VKENKDIYIVQCVWCGETIRADKEEDASGVCLKCFYRMLTDRLQSQKQSPYGEFVSDR
jgi:hypothetical protein